MSTALIGLLSLCVGVASDVYTDPILPQPEVKPNAGLGNTDDETLPGQVTSSIDVQLHGFARVEYGSGDRFGEASGEDQLGVSKMALVTEVGFENFKLVTVIGADILSDQDADTSLKDIFIVWSNIADSDFSLRLGAEPLLFGLKPEGYPGDHTIMPSIEFGGAGGFAVSNQAGAAAIFDYPVGDNMSLEFGFFDTDETTDGSTGSDEGSTLTENFFAQLRIGDRHKDGVYGVIGFESTYRGQTSAMVRLDTTGTIVDAGVGYRSGPMDISVETIMIDKDLTETVDDETYIVVEGAYEATDKWTLLADYATADELDAETLRFGGLYQINDHATFHVEYAQDDFSVGDDVDSISVRLTFSF